MSETSHGRSDNIGAALAATLLAAEGVTGPGEGIHVFLSSFDKRDVDGRDKPGQ